MNHGCLLETELVLVDKGKGKLQCKDETEGEVQGTETLGRRRQTSSIGDKVSGRPALELVQGDSYSEQKRIDINCETLSNNNF